MSSNYLPDSQQDTVYHFLMTQHHLFLRILKPWSSVICKNSTDITESGKGLSLDSGHACAVMHAEVIKLPAYVQQAIFRI